MKKLFPLIMVALFVNNANAQWQSNGPYTNYDLFTSIAISGSNVFAATGTNGVFLSTDNGGSWTEMNNGLRGDTSINALAAFGGDIFAGAYGGVFLSTNNGESWVTANSGLPNENVFSLAVSGGNVFAGTDSGVFLLPEGGGNWTAINNGLPYLYEVNAIAISGSNIFAAADNNGVSGNAGGVFLSTNNGGSWTRVNNGLTDTSVFSLAINGSNIFAGTSNGVFLSSNNGNSWSAMNNGMAQGYFVRALAASGTDIFAGTNRGVYLSTNNGANWSSVDSGSLNEGSGHVLSLGISPTTIFAGTDETGVWQLSLTGITGIQQIAEPEPFSFEVYPNPANNSFVVETSSIMAQLLQVFDITGQMLLTQPIENNKITIDASSWATGMYVVNIKSTVGVAAEKLVITK